MRFFFFCTAFLYCFLIACSDHAHAKNSSEYLKLEDALVQVYKRNPALQAAREELKETQELYPQARAGWLPSITAEASIFSTDVESSNFSNGTGATTKDMTLSLDQPIFRGGRTFAKTARARELIRAGEATLKQAEQDIFFKAVTVYMNLFRDVEIFNLRKTNEDILRTELHAAQERYNLGEATVTDVYHAQARYERSRSEMINAFSKLKSNEAEFFETIGIQPVALIKPDFNFDLPDYVEDMVLLAESQNPAILIAKYERKAAEHDIKATFRELLPQLSAFASYNKQYDPQPGIVAENETATIGARASLALYRGGATRSRIRETRRKAKRRQYQSDEIKQRVQQEITKNWRSYMAAHNETKSRKSEIEAADLALHGVREEARLGQRTILDILDAYEDVIDAKIALARAQCNKIVAQAALARSLGLLRLEFLLEPDLLHEVSREP